MTDFNVTEFLSTSNAETLDTQLIPFPAGEWNVQIGMDDETLQVKQGTSASGKPWARLEIKTVAVDPSGAIKAEMKREPNLTIRMMLDVDERGRFDGSKGKNVRMGQLLSACGLNQPGWNFNQLKGKVVRVKVKHEIYEGTTQANVVGYSTAS